MNIPDHIPTLWYEDKDGNFLGDVDVKNPYHDKPKGTHYQVSRFPFILQETWLRLTKSGSKKVATGEASWPEDLVNAMVRGDIKHQPMGACRAILISAMACERCTNALGHEYGLTWGYPEGSVQWHNCRTSCAWCDEKKRERRFKVLPYRLTVGDNI